MIIIGERLNTSRKGLEEAVEKRDEEFLAHIARSQLESGAGYLDVNCGTRIRSEVEDLKWLTQFVQSVVDAPLAIDSPNPVAAEAALEVHKGKPIINSISGEKERYESFIPLVKKYKAGVVALCMDDSGMPETADQKVSAATELVKRLNDDGVPNEDIYLDPLVQPVSSNQEFGKHFLEAVKRIMEQFPGIHTTCGLSNISHGLPKRKAINQCFVVMAVAAGLDTAIADPNDAGLMQSIIVAEALLGKDDYCASYLEAFRAGKIV